MNVLWIASIVFLLSKHHCHISGKVITYKTKYPYYVKRGYYPKPTKSINYCRLKLCPKGVRHLTCDSKFWGPKCGKIHEGVKINKKTVVKVHNYVRLKLMKGMKDLPKASRLSLFEWDDELALMAMRITNQCDQESANLCVNTFRSPNVAVTTDFGRHKHPPTGIYRFIMNWFHKHPEILPEYVSSFPADASRELLKFANMAYMNANRVGCAMLDGASKRFVACVYNHQVKPGTPLYKVQ